MWTKGKRSLWLVVAVAAMAGCGLVRKQPQPAAAPTVAVEPTPKYTPVPTVPPTPPTPRPTPKPLPTRPIKNPAAEAAKKAGKPIGPVITFLGISRADGKNIDPVATENGIPVYENYVGSGFFLVVEAKPGLSNLEVGRKLFPRTRDAESFRPDLQIQANRDLGDGSPDVCDNRRPNIGGIPGINPPSFADRPDINRALQDFACRFEIMIESSGACTVNRYGDYAFRNPETQTQFCMVVAKAWRFPVGDTLVTARLLDVEGNPGPPARFILRRPEERPRPKPRPRPSPRPTPPRRRP